jgi:hypothetical protein
MSYTRKTEVEASFKPAATIEERRLRLKKAREEVSRICQNPRQWRMCIPVQPDDTDIVLSAALTDARASLEELEQLRAKVKELDTFKTGVPWDAIRRSASDSATHHDPARSATIVFKWIVFKWIADNAPKPEKPE